MRIKLAGILAIIFSINLLFNGTALAQEEKKAGGPPPAKVVVGDVRSGMIAPDSIFIGSIYFAEVSDLSAEVSGKALKIMIEEGQRVKKGEVLVELSTEIIEKVLESTRSSYEQALADLDRAKLDLERVEPLFKQDAVSEKVYDENRFTVKALESRAASLRAEVAKLEIELGKMKIRSPFNGVVIKKSVDRGEWISSGSNVATVARDNEIDVIVNVPQDIVEFILIGAEVPVETGNRELKGKIRAVVPKGDIATRTFPVRIRLRNEGSLKEGMEARVRLPSGAKENVMLVNRDAVITQFGMTLVFITDNGKAKPVPVQVVGYDGFNAGVRSQGLKEGMKVVTKGNERLREGQPVVAGN